MRICIDIQPAVAQRAGIGRYTRQLVQSLSGIIRDDELAAFYFDFRRSGAGLGLSSVREQACRWCPGALAQHAWKRLNWPPANWLAGKADLYHFTNFILPPLSRGKAVVTIHDMGFMRYPQFAETRNLSYLRRKLPSTLARADAILTISHFSARELNDLYPDTADRTRPVPLGIDPSFQPASRDDIASVRKALGLDRPYLLSLGTIEPRKNYAFLVEVFEGLDDFDGDLVIAGMPGWHCKPILNGFRGSTRADRIRYLEYVPDGALAPLYTGAEAYVTTSYYEGFGFPPLEAMACGTPVVSSTGGSLGEVLGEAAILVDGFDRDEWIEAVSSVIEDRTDTADLTVRGTEQARRYTWERTARETYNVYRQFSS